MKYILDRLSEASTWRGIIMVLTSLGVAINPDLITPIITAGTGLAGVVGVVTKD
jgi:uncharacterized membrane protein